MKGSEKKVSFLSSSSPKGSDENDRGNQQKKTFTSPTISAASMVGFPRRKILSERNESPVSSNSFNAHFSRSTNLDSSPSPKTIRKVVSYKISSPNVEPTPLSSSPSPYDPLKNYLSPRPRFLRYNPDRRKEIFSRLEMEEDKEEDDTVSSENSSLNSSSSSLESGDESESSLDEEEVEEEDEEVTWSFRGISKYLLLFVVLILSTSYISSMNAPVDAPAFEGASVGFQNLSFGIVEGFDVGYQLLDLKQEQLGLLSFIQATDDEVVEEEMVEDEFEEELIMVGEESDEFEEELIMVGEESDEELIMVGEESDEELIMVGEESEEFADTIELKEIEDVDDIEQMGQETGEGIEFLQVDHQASLLSERRDSSEEISMVEVSNEASEDFHKEILQVAVNILETWGESIALKFRERNLPKGLSQDMGTGVAILVFGLLTCAAIVASFVFGSSIRRNGNASKHSFPVDDKHSTKPVVESSSLPLPAERDEPKKLDFSNTVPLITTSAMPVRSRGPSVQLLAEFDVGVRRPVESAPINRRMKDDEVTISSRSHSYFSEQGFSQLSAGNSNSSARSSAKKTQSRTRIGKNELAGYERNNEVMTPLRRSTRTRKCVASP